MKASKRNYAVVRYQDDRGIVFGFRTMKQAHAEAIKTSRARRVRYMAIVNKRWA